MIHLPDSTPLFSMPLSQENLWLSMADGLKKEGEEKALSLREGSDRELFRTEVDRLHQTLTHAIALLALGGGTEADYRRVYEEHKASLAKVYQQFQDRQKAFQVSSEAFAAQAAASSHRQRASFIAPTVVLSHRAAPSTQEVVDDNMEEIAKEAAKDLLKKSFPGGKGALKLGDKLYSNWVAYQGNEGENPVRDVVIANAANVVIADMAATFVPALPAYLTVCGAHIVSALSREALVALDHMQREPGQAELQPLRDLHYQLSGEGLSHAGSIELAKLLTKGLQFPSDRIVHIHEMVNNTLKHVADQCGITDDLLKKAVIAFGKYSPENMEEQMWAKAYQSLNAAQLEKH